MAVPLCRCRVLYIGSAVPIVTKDGLQVVYICRLICQGIQQPLRERYPVEDVTDTKGIDSWLSVWSNGILLEYIEGEQKSETAFFPINTLHYCAAVRYVNVSGYAVEGGGEKFVSKNCLHGFRFLPLDSPFANLPDSPHPPIFAAIFRRTTGVLECHGFICTNNRAANALVRCCFHAYADSIYLKMDDRVPGLKAIKASADRSPSPPDRAARSPTPPNIEDGDELEGRKLTTLAGWERRQQNGDYDSVSMSSTLGRGIHTTKRAASESGTASRHAIVPYGMQRRAGSETDLYSGGHPGAPRPGMMPPPPPRGAHGGMPPPFFPPFFPPPPFMIPPGMRGPPMSPPPPPHMRPPPFMMPPFGRHPPPPPPPPQHMRFPMPPFMHNPFFPPPPPPHHFFNRPQSPMPEPGSGPIITSADSLYGTLPRGRAYEEPTYIGVPTGIPEASYTPRIYKHEHYESMDTLRRAAPKKGPTSGSSIASLRGESSSAAAWDAYEAGIYRRPHINEKSRPDTPPVDYEAFESLKITDKQKITANGSSQRAAGVY